MKRFIAVFICVFLAVCVVPIFGCSDKIAKRSSYDIMCELSSDHVLSGSETVTFFNDEEVTIDHLKFNLFGNAFRSGAKFSPISAQYQSNAYPNGKSYGSMEIKSVTCGGESLTFEICGQDENALLVNLPAEIYPDESITVKIDFTIKLADVIARTGYNSHTVNLGNFYPILCVYDDGGFYECVYYANGDPFYSECADYTVKMTVDSDYVLAGGGKRVSQTTVGDKTTHTFKANNVRSFAFVASKEFKVASKVLDGVMINYYYYGDQTPEKSMEYIEKSLKYFGKTFGAYAYTDYSVVETPFVQGGMEYPTLVMISDKLEPESYGEVIVHETAHQWWQTAVGNNEIKYGFLDEGLAEYSVVLFYENHPEYGMTREKMIKIAEQTYKTYCSVYDKIYGKVDTSMLRSIPDYQSEYEYVNIAYIKTCIMYDYLRQTIGDGRFFMGLKKYYNDYRFKIATPDDLVGAFEKTGAGTNGFFDSFYQGKVIL